jgi:hypothetical protein
MSTTAVQSAAKQLIVIMGETIRDCGEVPSGHLYAQVMHLINLESYNMVIEILEKMHCIKVGRNHLITWIGPK